MRSWKLIAVMFLCAVPIQAHGGDSRAHSASGDDAAVDSSRPSNGPSKDRDTDRFLQNLAGHVSMRANVLHDLAAAIDAASFPMAYLDAGRGGVGAEICSVASESWRHKLDFATDPSDKARLRKLAARAEGCRRRNEQLFAQADSLVDKCGPVQTELVMTKNAPDGSDAAKRRKANEAVATTCIRQFKQWTEFAKKQQQEIQTVGDELKQNDAVSGREASRPGSARATPTAADKKLMDLIDRTTSQEKEGR